MATISIQNATIGVVEQEVPSRAQRMYVMGGIALIAAGMIFGDIFAIFVLHQNADRIGERLVVAVRGVAAADAPRVTAAFQNIGGLLENRGTKVDAHVHMIDFGYLALLLALLQPYVAFDESRKRRLARLFLWGSVLLPVGVFCIHYVGLRYSPSKTIGWASIVADLGGLLVLLALVGEAAGFLSWLRSDRGSGEQPSSLPRGWCARTLMAGGTLLVLAGFLHGAYYATFELSRAEASDQQTLAEMVRTSAAQDLASAERAVAQYGGLQAAKAIQIAAHSHVIEFGLLAMLLAFVQPYVMLAEAWRRRWVAVLLAGSVILPVFVLLELRLGLLAGGIADAGGAMVVVALLGMLVGVIRYSGFAHPGPA